MNLTAHETALLNFGREVLATLEADLNWSPDTLDSIADTAASYGLSKTNKYCEFEVVRAADFQQ